MVGFDDFAQLEIKIGRVLAVEKVPETDRLLKFELDFGAEQRIIVGGWALAYPDPAVLVGTLMPAILNLEPRVIKGIESQGMLLGATENNQPVALHPDRDVQPGSLVR